MLAGDAELHVPRLQVSAIPLPAVLQEMCSSDVSHGVNQSSTLNKKGLDMLLHVYSLQSP